MGLLFNNNNSRPQFRPIDACQNLRHLLALIVLTILTGTASAQDQTCATSPSLTQVLTSNGQATRNLQAKEQHVFQVTISSGQFMQVIVKQKGIDVIVRLFDPSDSLLIQRDSPNSRFGPEKVSMVAQVGGTYSVVVCGVANEPSGAYELKLDGPRQMSDMDDRRVSAEQAYFQAANRSENGNFEDAVKYYEEAARIWHELGDANEEGYAFSSIGDLKRFQRKFTESETNLETALTLLRTAGDLSGQAYVQNSWGATHRDGSTDLSLGIEKYQEAIALFRKIGDRWGEAQARNNLGLLQSKLGRNKEALENYKLAYPIWRELGVHYQEMNTLNNIGLANLHSGNLTEAYSQFQEVLSFCAHTTGPCRLEPFSRNSLGVIYDTWSQPNEAIAQYELALTLFRQLKEDTRGEQATALDNLGLLFIGLEDPNAALEKFQEALNLRRELKTPGSEAATRSNLGYAYIVLKNLNEAFKQLDQALLLSKKTNERFEGYTLMRLGLAHSRNNDNAKALELYLQALDVQTKIEDVRGQAMTLNQIAELYSSIEQIGNARRFFGKAQEKWQAVRDPQGEALSLYGLAKLERQQKNFSAARNIIVNAIAKVESVRTGTSNFRLRKTFFEARHDYYELETDIRMQLYYSLLAKKKIATAKAELEAALFAAERARSRNLLDLLSESQTNIREGVDAPLLEEEHAQRRQIDEKLNMLEDLSTQKGKEVQIATLQRELDALNSSLDQTKAKIRDKSPRYASLTQPQALTPAQIQALLDDETALMQYALGEERSYLWLVSRNSIRPYTLPGRAEIEKAVVALLDVIRMHEHVAGRPTEEKLKQMRNAPFALPKRAAELSNMVLRPLVSKTIFKRIIIVADGSLQYVPFGALAVPNEANTKAASTGQRVSPLIANYELVYEPSASVLALIRKDQRRTAPMTVAVIADPVFSKRDERVQKSESSINSIAKEDTRYLMVLRDAGDIGSVGGSLRLMRLNNSRKEAEAIIAATSQGSSMAALDFDASRDKALSEELKRFKIIHLATHGILDSAKPELSGLVFSLVDKQGESARGFLRLNDIYNLNLPADLVVLSACQTALGQEFRSEGVTGLTRGFMYAGAARVVASLWKVDDLATAELMKRFYTYMLDQKMTASQALRQAQLDISAQKEEWRPSFYWAGFVLQGEWK